MMASQSSSQEIQLTFKYVDGKFIPVVQKDPIDEAYGSAMSSGEIFFNYYTPRLNVLVGPR